MCEECVSVLFLNDDDALLFYPILADRLHCQRLCDRRALPTDKQLAADALKPAGPTYEVLGTGELHHLIATGAGGQ